MQSGTLSTAGRSETHNSTDRPRNTPFLDPPSRPPPEGGAGQGRLRRARQTLAGPAEESREARQENPDSDCDTAHRFGRLLSSQARARILNSSSRITRHFYSKKELSHLKKQNPENRTCKAATFLSYPAPFHCLQKPRKATEGHGEVTGGHGEVTVQLQLAR